MAQKVKEGVDSVEGCEGVLYQVPETLPEEVLGKMGAPPKDADIPIITAAELEQADGILFGIPTRFGMAASQMKSFMDSTGSQWQNGKLMGKPAGVFFSTGTQVCRTVLSYCNVCANVLFVSYNAPYFFLFHKRAEARKRPP